LHEFSNILYFFILYTQPINKSGQIRVPLFFKYILCDVGTSLDLIFIYCKYKSIVAILIMLHNHALSHKLYFPHILFKSRDMSVGIVLSYMLDKQGSRAQFLVGAGNFSVHHCIQNGSGAHPTSYPMGTRGSFPGGKATRVWSWPLTPI
jgi:hypothetical protein